MTIEITVAKIGRWMKKRDNMALVCCGGTEFDQDRSAASLGSTRGFVACPAASDGLAGISLDAAGGDEPSAGEVTFAGGWTGAISGGDFAGGVAVAPLDFAPASTG
jgi:hypothetical protein